MPAAGHGASDTMRDLGNEKKRFGYRRLCILLRQEGEPSGINQLPALS
jgi:hypothetical protein